MEIDADRLIADMRALAAIGGVGTGVDRTAFSPADVESRRWLAGRLAEAGLSVRSDRFGTLVGAWPGVDRAILVGSHTDTVPRGGWLDGAMGVVYALELARAARDSGHDGPVGIDVIDFQDEEGTYFPCLGSLSFAGGIADAAIEAARSTDGRRLVDAMAEAGYGGEPLRLDPGRHAAYLEAHIEQGPRLTDAGTRIGVVTGFVGTRRMSLSVHGRADHAGTTPMDARRDASLPVFAFASWVQKAFPVAAGPGTVWNIGRVQFGPGAANVVPRHAVLILEFRDRDDAVLDRLQAMVTEEVARLRRVYGLEIDLALTGRIEPVATDPRITGILADSARDFGIVPLPLPSGAGHDCMLMAPHIPAGMIFVPSIGGRSHDVDEDTAEEDIVLGCRVMARALDRLLAAG